VCFDRLEAGELGSIVPGLWELGGLELYFGSVNETDASKLSSVHVLSYLLGPCGVSGMCVVLGLLLIDRTVSQFNGSIRR
jgi:hypothetical protein